MFDLITIGDSVLDTIIILDEASVNCDINHTNCQLCLNYADKLSIAHSEQTVGGNAANVAVGTTKLGLKTAIITELGGDPSGLTIKKELQKAKVNLSLIKLIKKAKTLNGIVLTYQGERTILSCQAKRNYTLPKLSPTKWIYYTSLGQSFEKLQVQLQTYLTKHPEIKLAVNPGSYQLRHGIETIKKILPLAEILFINKEEAKNILNQPGEAKNLIPLLQKMGAKNVVVTDGNQGSFASDGQKIYHLDTFPVKVVSKTGAGDAYTSGFLSAIIAGKSIPEAMRYGTANSCATIQQFGAQKGLLNPASLKKMLKTFSKIVPQLV